MVFSITQLVFLYFRLTSCKLQLIVVFPSYNKTSYNLEVIGGLGYNPSYNKIGIAILLYILYIYIYIYIYIYTQINDIF